MPDAADRPGPAAARRLWRFPALYLGWAYLCWLPLLWYRQAVWSAPGLFCFLAGGASPLIAGVVLAARDGGQAQVRDLLRRLVRVRGIALRGWIALLGFWLAFDLLLGQAAIVLGVTDQPFSINWQVLREPSALGFLLLLSFVFPAIEEIGLRGYYLDALRQRCGITSAAFINGVTWALWHAPFVWFHGYYANTTFHPALSWWLPMIVCTTLLIAQVYERSGRSIFAVLLFHAMMNFTGELLGIRPAMYPFVLAGYALAAGLLIWHWHQRRPGQLRGGPVG